MPVGAACSELADIVARAPIAHLLAPVPISEEEPHEVNWGAAPTAQYIDVSSVRHPFTAALLGHLRALFRPTIDAHLSGTAAVVDASDDSIVIESDGARGGGAAVTGATATATTTAHSGRRVLWPKELVELVIDYL